MNILIFAGGAGTRLWPLSRSASPKQFEVLKDDKSTLQMAIDRVEKFGLENVLQLCIKICIQTGPKSIAQRGGPIKAPKMA